ncbi:Mbov_0396 family ICE element transmembrane protein [Mesomycoplasma ovipneumoniae]|uniref:Mbov_0396 family ICE element transmembrane protein n=1 Tax=Mesomycoplasma ovipneumoniae TaxID=29562 RepID=UPI00311B064E
MFGWLFSGLINIITYPFFTLGWYLLVYLPFSVIAFFNYIFEKIGINIIVHAIFNRQTFSFESLPIGFWIFAIASISMGFIVLILRYVKFLIIRRNSADTEIAAMSKVSVGSFIFIFTFPVIFFALLIAIQSTLTIINNYISADQNLIELMLKSASNKIPDSEIQTISQDFSVPSYSTFTSMESGEGIILIITLSASSIVVAYILGISFISLFTASAQLFMNFITMPLWAVSSIWDDGRKLKTWTRTFFGQFAVIIIYQVSFNLFLIWVASTYKIADSIDFEGAKGIFIFRFLLKISFIIGGGLAISTFTRQIAANYGQAGAVEHHQRLASSTLKVGGVALAGAAGTMFRLNQNNHKNATDLTGLPSKWNQKKPFDIIDNSILPNQKQSPWRNAMNLVGIGTGVAFAATQAKPLIRKWRNYRANRALNGEQKGLKNFFNKKINSLFSKFKRGDSSQNLKQKPKNTRSTIEKTSENPSSQNKIDEAPIINQNDSLLTEKSATSEDKLQQTDSLSQSKNESSDEKQLKMEKNDVEITPNSDQQENSESKGDEKQQTENPEIVEKPAKKKGFWARFWGEWPEEETKKTRRKSSKTKDTTSETETKKAKKAVKKKETKAEKASEPKEKKVKIDKSDSKLDEKTTDKKEKAKRIKTSEKSSGTSTTSDEKSSIANEENAKIVEKVSPQIEQNDEKIDNIEPKKTRTRKKKAEINIDSQTQNNTEIILNSELKTAESKQNLKPIKDELNENKTKKDEQIEDQSDKQNTNSAEKQEKDK